MAACKKCKTALFKCSECNGSGKVTAEQKKCVRCKGTGLLCHVHGADHGA